MKKKLVAFCQVSPSLPTPLSQSLTFKEEKISNNKFYADFQEMQ